MQYPFFDFPFYHPSPDIDLKRIYPIGSIIFRSSPLANKTEWTEVSLLNSQLNVEWEGMTWELIVSIKPDDLANPFGPWGDFHSQVHSVRNVRLQYTRTPEELARGVCSAHMVIDDQNQGTFNLDTFTGNNSHNHNLAGKGYACIHFNDSHNGELSAKENSTPKWRRNRRLMQVGAYDTSEPWDFSYGTDLIGNTQNGSTKEYAYNLFMYKRIA